MDFNYTSAHARVFDGIRTARFRAMADDQPEEPCKYDHDTPASLLWVHAPSGAISPLCRDHTAQWLAGADEIDEHPPALIPLRGRRHA